MAETQAQKEARWRAEGYVQSKGGAWVKPGTAAYDQAMALDAKRDAEYQAIASRRTMAEEAAKAYSSPTEIARMLAEGKRQGKSVIETIDTAPETKAAEDAAKAAAAGPPDTFGVVERELARARTQLQMMATNGRAGSVLGIGTGGYTGGSITPNNTRVGGRIGGDEYRRRPVGGGNPNTNQRRATSVFNLPFAHASRGMR